PSRLAGVGGRRAARSRQGRRRDRTRCSREKAGTADPWGRDETPAGGLAAARAPLSSRLRQDVPGSHSSSARRLRFRLFEGRNRCRMRTTVNEVATAGEKARLCSYTTVNIYVR